MLSAGIRDYLRKIIGRIVVRAALGVVALIFIFIGLFQVVSAIGSLLEIYLPAWAASLISGLIALLLGLLLIAIAVLRR